MSNQSLAGNTHTPRKPGERIGFITLALLVIGIYCTAPWLAINKHVQAQENESTELAELANALAATGCPLPDKPVRGMYYGTTTTTIRVINAFGQVVGTPTYQYNSVLNVNSPLRNARYYEDNPFHLLLSPQPMTNRLGETVAYSAFEGDGYIFQYWKYATSSGKISGNLIDNKVALGISLNQITTPIDLSGGMWHPLPLDMANGTTMIGVFNRNEIAIRISGNTTDMQHPFRVDFTGKLNATARNNCIFLPSIHK